MSTVAKLSLAEYERIAASGVFNWPNNRHIELIKGELRETSPPTPAHADIDCWLGAWSVRSVPINKIGIRVRSPLAFARVDSEPEPDIAWVKSRRYFKAHPTAADALLVIEVADSSLDDDLVEKAQLYATVGIPEYWVVNLVERTVEVFRNPHRGRYRSHESFAVGSTIRPLAVPKAKLNIAAMFDVR